MSTQEIKPSVPASQLIGQLGYEEPTDAQCDEFRRLPGSFNDMIRKVYAIGRMQGAQESVEVMKAYYPRSGCVSILEDHFDFKVT